MKRYVVLHKEIGTTPLEVLREWQESHPEYKDVKASYAGRLDPMASGKLLILLGEECKRQSRYTKLDKEYEIEVLLDISTDTGDVLGLPSYRDVTTYPTKTDIEACLKKLVGSAEVPYPAYSSKTVNGTPLFLHTLQGTLDTIEIPTHTERIYELTRMDITRSESHVLEERIDAQVALAPRDDSPSKALGNDFRQDEIRAAWSTVFRSMPARSFVVVRLRVICASGTYMRTLAGRIGTLLGTSGITLSIHRTKIGRVQMFGPFLFWTRLFS